MKTSPGAQAEFLCMWSEEELGMTCNVPDKFLSTFSKKKENHPAKEYFMDQDERENDGYSCLMYMQQHECDGYCLRKRK